MRTTWIAAVALALATSGGLQAQDSASTPKQDKIQWSLMGGATFTTLTGSTADTANLSSRVGFVASAGLAFNLSRSFAIGIEGSLIQKGAQQANATTRPGLGYTILYLEVPLLLRWNLSPGKQWQPVLLAGPSFAWELDCKMPMAYLTAVINSTCYAFAPYSRETMDVGGVAGIELHRGMFYPHGTVRDGVLAACSMGPVDPWTSRTQRSSRGWGSRSSHRHY